MARFPLKVDSFFKEGTHLEGFHWMKLLHLDWCKSPQMIFRSTRTGHSIQLQCYRLSVLCTKTRISSWRKRLLYLLQTRRKVSTMPWWRSQQKSTKEELRSLLGVISSAKVKLLTYRTNNTSHISTIAVILWVASKCERWSFFLIWRMPVTLA